MSDTSSSKVLTFLAELKPEDLDGVDAEIAQVQARLAQLQGVRSLLAKALGQTPPDHRIRPGRPTPPDLHDLRCKAARLLIVAGGPMRRVELCEALNLPTGSPRIDKTTQHPWFLKGPDGIRITAIGREENPK